MFSAFKKSEDAAFAAPSVQTATAKAAHAFDELTGGAFSAPTSGERAAKIREWLSSNPSVSDMQEVFKDMTARDKGAAKPLREKLDEIKRSAAAEHIAAEWAEKANALLAGTKLNIADALAWQRDAAKAGAPLSKEPLAGLKSQLSERVKHIEDLQHRAQVQREASMLLAQRMETLSTKALADAQAAQAAIEADVAQWRVLTSALQNDPQWGSADPKFVPQLETAQSQLHSLFDAFSGALAQAAAAIADKDAPLPAVPVWADGIRAARGQAMEPQEKKDKPVKPKVDPEKRSQAIKIVREELSKLEQELKEGHGKASAQAANSLRAALKEQAAWLDEKTENLARDALGAAGEMEGWQRWRANQIREELIVKAQELVAKPLGGRKQQEAVRNLREAWKQTDQGGMPNHGMWRKFDEACNEAHKIVAAWLDKVKADEALHKAQRLAIIEEIGAWNTANGARTDWKAIDRELHALSEKWRSAGHVGEKAFAELQPQYKAVIKLAHAPLETAQKSSLQRRKALIEEAALLGNAPMLRIDAVKALQGRWQAEAASVPMDRKEEQKLWDAFRKPIDEAFAKKSEARSAQAAAMSAHDKQVLDATQALDVAIASGDAKAIRAAMQALEAAASGQALAQTTPEAPKQAHEPQNGEKSAQNTEISASNEVKSRAEYAQAATENIAFENSPTDAVTTEITKSSALEPTLSKVVVVPKAVIARRGDDRPGAKLSAAPAAFDSRKGGDKKFDRRDGRDASRKDPRDDKRADHQQFVRGAGSERPGSRFSERRESQAPRLSNTAFYAMRDGMDKAQIALKKIASSAHGEIIVALLDAWKERDGAKIPTAQQLGKSLTPAVRNQWVQALGAAAGSENQVSNPLLRLEMAAQVPTPADQLEARRALQLQLLTQRGQPGPQETWASDAALILSSSHNDANARRLQNALKALLR